MHKTLTILLQAFNTPNVLDHQINQSQIQNILFHFASEILIQSL